VLRRCFCAPGAGPSPHTKQYIREQKDLGLTPLLFSVKSLQNLARKLAKGKGVSNQILSPTIAVATPSGASVFQKVVLGSHEPIRVHAGQK
jgi:hypothetical protein